MGTAGMDTTTDSESPNMVDSDNQFVTVRRGDRVRIVYLNHLRTAKVLRHEDGRVYCQWKEVVIVRQFSQVIPV
jgi:hypothetical protein